MVSAAEPLEHKRGVGWTKDVLDKAGGSVGVFDAGYDGIGGRL